MNEQELLAYVRSIKINGKKLNGAEREEMLAACAVRALKERSPGYSRAGKYKPFDIRVGFPDDLSTDAPHG